MISTVLDTGPPVAALNTSDRRHAECAALLVTLSGRRLLPSPVMTEVCWLLERWPKVEAAFLNEVARGTFELVHLTPADLIRRGQLVVRYADFPLGTGRVATLDQRHFNTVRPAHLPALTLLP